MEKHNDTEVITRLKYTSENIVAIMFCCAKFEKKGGGGGGGWGGGACH